MTPEEAAQHYGVSLRTIRRWIATGQVEAKRLTEGGWEVFGRDIQSANNAENVLDEPSIREELAQLRGLFGGQITANLDRRLETLALSQSEMARHLEDRLDKLGQSLSQAVTERDHLREDNAALRKQVSELAGELKGLREELRKPWWRRWWK